MNAVKTILPSVSVFQRSGPAIKWFYFTMENGFPIICIYYTTPIQLRKKAEVFLSHFTFFSVLLHLMGNQAVFALLYIKKYFFWQDVLGEN